MERLSHVLEIGPKHEASLEKVGVRTVSELAEIDDLQDLSQRTDIPVSLLRQWREQAKQQIRASKYQPYQRRAAIAIAATGLVILALLLYFRSPDRTSDQANALYTQADKAFDAGDYQRALKLYDEVIQLQPTNQLAYANKGGALRRLGRTQEALAALGKALELNPKDGWALRERGRVYIDLHKYNDALNDYDRAIGLDPKDEDAYANKGLVLRRLGKYEDALRALARALELDAKDAWVYNERGITYQENLYQYESAYEDLQKASALQPQEFSYKTNLAEATWTSGRFGEAASLALEILADNERTNGKMLGVSERLTMRFIVIASLLMEGQTTQAKTELESFVRDYHSARSHFPRQWDYSGDRHFINNRAMDGRSKEIILALIDLLDEPPKSTIGQIEKFASGLK